MYIISEDQKYIDSFGLGYTESEDAADKLITLKNTLFYWELEVGHLSLESDFFMSRY